MQYPESCGFTLGWHLQARCQPGIETTMFRPLSASAQGWRPSPEIPEHFVTEARLDCAPGARDLFVRAGTLTPAHDRANARANAAGEHIISGQRDAWAPGLRWQAE